MKIAFNPSTVAALTTPPNNKDITFDLRGRNIFARGVEFKGTDTNTWRDIKINNVSIGSHTLDLRNGSNTTLTNTNGVVTINSTWRPVVDNLTSDSTTSSLSAKQGKVLKALIDGKSNSDHNHDGRYVRYYAVTTLDCNNLASGLTVARVNATNAGTAQHSAYLYISDVGTPFQIQIPDSGASYIYKRYYSSGKWSGWFKLNAGYADSAGSVDWANVTNKPATATRWPSWAEVTGKPSSFTPSTHTHGLSNSVFFLNMPSISGNAKWKEVFGYPVNYNLLLSVRINSPAPEWCVGNYGSGILYGGSDTKGFMSSAYDEPLIMWAGGNGSSDDSVPKWYIGIRGTHKSIYNLTTIASEANAAYNLRHSHANKSVLDGITSGLVNSWNTAYNFVSNITGTDTDKVINKWEEIVNFLAGITEDNKLNTLLNSKLSIQQLSAKDILTTKTNNALFWVDTKGNASTITTGPFTDHPYALLSVTNYNQNAENHKFFYRSRLAFSSAGDIKVASCHHEFEYQQDETWYNVLTSKNSGINGSTIKLNGTSITVYSSGTADGRYVKKSGDTMSGVLTIDTTNFGALTIKRNDDANGASIQFRGKSSVYGYIGLNNSTKDKQFLRWSSDTSRIYTILDTSSTYISNGKGVINGTTITQVDNATNSTNSTNARKLVNWYSARPTSLNAQFGDGSLRIFYATSSTTEGKPAEDSHILHLAWDNTGGWDAQLAVHTRSGKVSTRAQNGGTWQPWKTLAFTTDIPSSLKNPYSFNVFGVVYDGSAAKTVTTSTFISQVTEGTSTITDGTMLITSYASNSGFADTNAANVPYKRKAIHLWEYIKAKTDSLYATKVHNHDGRYLRLSGQDTMQGNLYLHSHGPSYIGKGLGDKSGADFTEANIVIRSWWGISFKSYDDIVRTYIDTRTGNIGTKGVLNAVGAVIQGRVYNGGDDEGIIINPAPNGYAGLILGTHNGERSVFYLKKGNPFWRYNNGSTNLDIYHPKKSGTIALTSDIPNKDSWNYDDRYLRLTGGWMSGDINFGGDKKIHWGRNTDSASISFKNDGDGDANSYMSFVTSDNGNEYFRWSHSSGSTNTEWMALRSDGLRVRGTKVSLEGHSHNDLYYTKVESNAKYITDIATSVNKLTFTRNGSNIARNITVNVVYSQGNLTNIPNKDATTKASSGLYIYNSYNQVIGTNPYSSVLSINTGGTIQIAGNWGDDQTRNLYWRSQSDRNVADYPWKSWRTILDSENYSFTLDSRYYTESEVNSLLSKKLNTSDFNWTNLPGKLVAGNEFNIVNAGFNEEMWFNWLPINNRNSTATVRGYHFGNGAKGYASVQASGFIKTGSSSSYVLLGDGGHKLEGALNVANADTVDGYHATDGRTFNGDIHWGSWNDTWSDGTHTHPWYGFDHRYPNTGTNSTTISDYFGMTIKTYNTLLLDCGTLLLNSRNNVGIGTTSPTQKLDVHGNIRATGQIIREGSSQIWVYGRNAALLRETSVAGYHTLWSLKTTDGSWDFGEYNINSAWNNIPVLSYITDSNYNSGNNATTYQIKFPLASGTVALTSNIPNPTNYYWANVKISASSSTTTSPTVSNLTATNSIRMSNILLEHTDEINNITNGGIYLNYRNSGNVSLCYGGGNVGIGTTTFSYKLDVNGQMRASGFHHSSVNSDNYILLAGGGYKSFGGDDSTPIFLGYLHLYNGNDGTISGSFPCLGYSVPFTYTRGGAYCLINIPNTTHQVFYIKAAVASVHYSGAGMGHWVGNHRGDGAWWLHCDAVGSNAVQVKGFHLANKNNDSWWGGNPLYSGDGAAKIITVCLFGYVLFR